MTLDICSEKEEGKVERGQKNAPRKASLEYRVRLPFLYQFVISFMEPKCKHQRDHGNAFPGSLAELGAGLRFTGFWSSIVVLERQ